MIDRFRRASIRFQFIVLASIAIPAILLSVIALLPEPFIFQNGQSEKLLTVRRAQIELIVTQLRNTAGDVDLERLVESTAPAGLRMKILPWSSVSTGQEREEDIGAIADELRRVLPVDFEAVVLESVSGEAGNGMLAVRIDAQRGLLIRLSDSDLYSSFSATVAEFISKVAILILPMILLVLYIGGMITSPLTRFAEAAKRLRLDDNEEELFASEGAEELRALATSLNDMRRRIRKMVDDRTRMLTAVSHDLRTPLTRLRMRLERSKDPASKEAMLADIDTLTAMIEESLQYLSSTATAEALRKVDIANLLQTITSGFFDLGHAVTYSGPERLGYLCKQRALTRAITNIVENAVRFGTVVRVELRHTSRGEALIAVSDNGPGLADNLHDKVLEPFFKADEARTLNSNSGFGLGLSIADEIVKGHGGSLLLENISPHGLRVTIFLPPTQVVPLQNSKAASAKGKALAREALAKSR